MVTGSAPPTAEHGKPESRTLLSVKCASSFTELDPLSDEWNKFVEEIGSDIYFTTDWLKIWWKHYGSGRELRCFLVRASGQLVATLPFCVHTVRAGPISVRVARFVGSDSTIPVFVPPVAPNYERVVLGAVLQQLLKEDRCDTVSLSPLSGEASLTKAVHELCAVDLDFRLARDESLGPHTLVHLPETFDTYFTSLRKQQRSNYTRDLAHLSKRLRLAHHVFRGSKAVECFEGFVLMHQAQWTAAARLGHFRDWPGSTAFNRELVKHLAEKDQVRLYVLDGDGEPLSIQYAFVLRNRCYWRLPARTSDIELERLGIGRLGLVKMIEALIDERVDVIEAGPGHYDYKLRHGGSELSLRQVVITSSSRIWKARLALLWSDLLHLLYFRVWFLKIAPSLPWLQRPLWRTWIRTRL